MSAVTGTTPAERLARRFFEAMLAEAGPHGFVQNPLVTTFEQVPADERAHLVAACRRLLDDEVRIRDAWSAWEVAGQMPWDEPRDPEAPPMPAESWP